MARTESILSSSALKVVFTALSRSELIGVIIREYCGARGLNAFSAGFGRVVGEAYADERSAQKVFLVQFEVGAGGGARWRVAFCLGEARHPAVYFALQSGRLNF